MPEQRLKIVLDPTLFENTLSLMQDRRWLMQRQAALVELQQELATNDEIELINNLISRFKYLDGYDIQACAESISQHIRTAWNLKPNNTMIVSKNPDSASDSSGSVNYILQQSFSDPNEKWSKANFSPRLRDAISNKEISNIVIADEYSGSGNSLAGVCDWIEKELQKKSEAKSIYACFFCISDATKTRKFELLSGLYSAHVMPRGISDYFESESNVKLSIMKEIESRMRVGRAFQFGYEQTEAIYAAQNFNIPNNNFPFLWWPKKNPTTFRRPLFSRIKR